MAWKINNNRYRLVLAFCLCCLKSLRGSNSIFHRNYFLFTTAHHSILLYCFVLNPLITGDCADQVLEVTCS